MFRIMELSSGKVEIDGIDISTIGLTDLRSKLAVIPQVQFMRVIGLMTSRWLHGWVVGLMTCLQVVRIVGG